MVLFCPGNVNPGGNIGMPFGRVGIENAGNPGIEAGMPWLVTGTLSLSDVRSGPLSYRSSSRRSGLRNRDGSSSSCSRFDRGPLLPPLSVCMRRLMAFEDTPWPISISGSSTTIPLSIGLPPLPPYSAVSIHLRSASVSLPMGIMLTPVW